MFIVFLLAVSFVLFGIVEWTRYSTHVPFSDPHVVYDIDITGKRLMTIDDFENYVQNYVINVLVSKVEIRKQFDDTLIQWDSDWEKYISNHRLCRKDRVWQYKTRRSAVIQSDYNMFQFVFYRKHTRYKQINYQKHPYLVDDVDYIAEYSLKELLSMIKSTQGQTDILSEKNGNYIFGEKSKDYFDQSKPLKSKPETTDATSKLNTDVLSSPRPVYFDDTLKSAFLPVYPEYLPDAFNAYLEEKLPMTLDVFDQVRKQYEKQWIPGCYVIYDMVEKKYYVGQAKDVWGRVQQHISGASCKSKNPQTIDVNLKIKKHQAMIRVIKIGTADIVDLNEMERRLIAAYDSYRNGYNLTKGNG